MASAVSAKIHRCGGGYGVEVGKGERGYWIFLFCYFFDNYY